MTRFENWSIQVHLGQYRIPRLTSSALYLCGNVYGHHDIGNGRRIKSSKILGLDIKDKLVQTVDAVYRLGKPDRRYIEWLERNKYSLDDLLLK